MKRQFWRHLLVVALLIVAIHPARADGTAFQQIISRQIEAFRTGDGETAFSFASPFLQMRFLTPGNFLAMVRRGYAAVLDPRRLDFRETATDTAGRPVQVVEIVDSNGNFWTARYTFEHQPDGSWRIAAVTLERASGSDV